MKFCLFRTVSSKRRSGSRKRDEPVRLQKIRPKDQATGALSTLAAVGVSALPGVLESEMYKVETQLEEKSLQTVFHQPLMESRNMKSEQLEEQQLSPDELDSAEKQYTGVQEETEGYSSPHEDSTAAKEVESNYGGTTPTASLELSHGDEKGDGLVPISHENVDQRKVEGTETIEEQQG
uniref:Uncharacterized protein n=1 Tax=Parascaris equorum TaxID=6256 RepID=A0A914RRR7_PAREQ